MNNRLTSLAFVLLGISFTSIWASQAWISAWCNDESAHIPAGLYQVETGRTDAYRVNPPLPRMIAAIPLLLDRPNVDWHYSDSPYVRNEYQFAHQWVVDNADSLPRYLFLARSTVLIFFVIGLWSIIRWASRMYGTVAACLAGTMWSLNPDIITNSAVVAPDLPAAAMGLLAGYGFWDWLGRNERPFPWSVAAVVSLAILCKFSWLFLLPMLPLVTLAFDLVARCRRADGATLDTENGAKRTVADVAVSKHVHAEFANLETRANAHAANQSGVDRSKVRNLWGVVRDAVRLTLSFSLTFLIINWCYGFEGTGTRLGDFQFISNSMAGPGVSDGTTGNRFEDGPLAWMPVPLPREMLRGLDYLNWEFEKGMPCYLNGTWQHRGWWYFHLYAMAVKIPLGYWVLIACGLFSLVWQTLRRGSSYPLEWMPILIAVLFIALVSSQTGFTHHVRYVLPTYGFLFLTASRVVTVLPSRLGIVLATVCLSGTIWFHATHLGQAHTFFNPLAGGPNNGWRHLSFSNVDWGQSTYRMVDWVKEHPEQRPMTVLFHSSLGSPENLIQDQHDVFSSVSWRESASDANAAPTRQGWYLISSFQMTQSRNRFLWHQTPVSQPDPDMLLFYLSDADIAAVAAGAAQR